ncbi:MAG: hypothetical protein ACKPJD_04260, partial [Planctomycetaceae bacterium]
MTICSGLMLAQAGAEPMAFGSVLLMSLAAIFGLVLLVFAIMFATVARLWFRAWMSGASIG